jgi:hypothetical protein
MKSNLFSRIIAALSSGTVNLFAWNRRCDVVTNLSIGDYVSSEFPELKTIQHFFLDFTEAKWPSGGRLAIYGAQGTESLPPYKGRVDISLAIVPDSEHGFYLIYSKTGVVTGGQFHSLGSQTLTRPGSPMIEIDENGYAIAAGLFVSPADAWAVVKRFIETNGERSDAIQWLTDAELPDSAISTPFSE